MSGAPVGQKKGVGRRRPGSILDVFLSRLSTAPPATKTLPVKMDSSVIYPPFTILPKVSHGFFSVLIRF